MSKSKKGSRFIRFLSPLLEALKELGGSGQPSEVKGVIAERLNLSEDELNDTIASGASRYSKDVDWARYYLAKADYLDASTRGVWSLTEKGRHATITETDALQIYNDVHMRLVAPKRKKQDVFGDSNELGPIEPPTPEDVDHRAALIRILQALPPEGFERLCQRLLRESGFESVTVTGKSGDGGLDGIGVLSINPFVSFRVLFQCKRYSGSVTPSQVRDFRGAMTGRTDKGLFITTGVFTAEAKREAAREGAPPIELVDSEKLLDMFERLELGLKPKRAYDVDTGFFAEFQT